MLVYGFHFRAPRCVARHAEKIRTYFRPIPEEAQSIRAALEPLRRAAEVVVGVHMRYGDKRWSDGGRFVFPIARYAAWMREVAGQFPGRKVAFLICSDEPRSAQEFSGLSVGFGPGTPLGDMYALAGCDCIFGSLSTFSQWASFYGQAPLKLLCSPEDRLVRSDFRVSNLEAMRPPRVVEIPPGIGSRP